MARFCILLACAKRMASCGGATPLASGQAQAGPVALQYAKHCVRSYKTTGKPAQGCPWGQCRGKRVAVRKTLCPKLQSKVQTRRACARGQCRGRRTAVRKRSARSCKAKCKPVGRRLEAVPRKTLTKAWGAVAVASKYQPTPPGSARGAMPG